MLTRDEALALADSNDSVDRAAAAGALVPFEDDATDRALLRLFSDPDDTAVTEAALEAVIRRKTQRSVELLLHVIATGDDEAVDHLMYFLDVRKRELWTSDFRSRVASALHASRPTVVEGARELLAEVGWDVPGEAFRSDALPPFPPDGTVMAAVTFGFEGLHAEVDALPGDLDWVLRFVARSFVVAVGRDVLVAETDFPVLDLAAALDRWLAWDTASTPARVFVLAFLVVFAALVVVMYTTFTYRRPRGLVPPVLRRPLPRDDD